MMVVLNKLELGSGVPNLDPDEQREFAAHLERPSDGWMPLERHRQLGGFPQRSRGSAGDAGLTLADERFARARAELFRARYAARLLDPMPAEIAALIDRSLAGRYLVQDQAGCVVKE